MGALGDVIDRFNTFPTPVKILVVGGIGVAGYLGYRHYVSGAGGASGSSSDTIPLDLAPQGTSDNLSANGPGTGSGSTGTTTTSTGSGSTGTTTTGTGSGSTTTTKKPVKKPVKHPVKHPVKKPVKKPVKHQDEHEATVTHLRATAATHKHPNIGFSTHEEHDKHVSNRSGSGKRATLH